MTEHKQPQAGEWWISKNNDIVRIVGVKMNGQVVYEMAGGGHSASSGMWPDWHHEPACTGFDWQPETFPQCWTAVGSSSRDEVAYVKRVDPRKYVCVFKTGEESATQLNWSMSDNTNRTRLTPNQAAELITKIKPPAIDPGEGWELLPVGTVLQDGDECGAGGVWYRTVYAGAKIGDHGTCCTYRRRKPTAEPIAAERIPDNRPARDVFMDVLEWLNPEDETSPTNVAAAVETIEQWLEDNPAEPIAHPVERTATPLVTAVVESQDDWVEITESHPGHIRRACDEVCNTECEPVWIPVRSSVGMPQSDFSFTRIRCRRRDVPAPPAPPAPQPKRTPVRLWVSWRIESERGDWPIRCTPADEEFDDGGRSVWKEIKIDGTTLFVEGE